MEPITTRQADGSLTISFTFKPEGNMLQQEEQIRQAVNALGCMATAASLKSFDTDGAPIQLAGINYTSKGEKKKSIRPLTAPVR